MRALRPLLGCIVVLGIGCLRMRSHTGPWPCTSNEDCETGERCISSNAYAWAPSVSPKTCMPESYCVLNTDCAADEQCQSNACVPAQCSMVNDPACGPFDCDPSSRTCYRSCYGTSTYCSAGHVCGATSTCIDDACASIAPDGVCPGGYRCSAGACWTSCSGNAGCATGYTCSSGRCSASGAADAGVPAPKDAGAKPVPEAAPSGKPLFAVCANNADCQSRACCHTSDLGENHCFNSCTVLPIGSPCHGNADCESGMCHLTSGTLGFCTKSCTSDAQCGLNYYDLVDSKNLCVTANNLDFYCYPGCDYSAPTCDVNCGWSCVCQRVGLGTDVCTPL